MDRFEQHSSGTLELTLSADADDAVTISITDGAGAPVVEDAATTKPPDTVGRYVYDLTPAELASLDVFRFAWRYSLGGNEHIKAASFFVVGSFHTTVEELRAFSDSLFADEEAYPTKVLVRYRELAEELLERECGVAFSPQGRRVRTEGLGEPVLPLPVRRARRVVSAAIDGAPLEPDELAEVLVYYSEVYRPAGWPRAGGTRNVELHVEHGYDEPPAEIREATKWIVRDLAEAPPSDLDTRAQTISNDRGTQRLGIAGTDGPTGMPYVDAVIARFTEGAAELSSLQIRSEAAWPIASN